MSPESSTAYRSARSDRPRSGSRVMRVRGVSDSCMGSACSPPACQSGAMPTTDHPVIVTAYFYPRPEARAQVLAALQPAIAAVHEEDGCELYAIHDAPDGSIVMLEKW